MKIGIEAQRISRKKKHGMDIVAIELIKKLQVIDTVNQYFIFIKDDEDNAVVTETANFKVIKIKSAPYPYWEQVLLPKAVKDHGLDVLHCTSNTAPLSVTVPLVITLHDIIYLEKINFTKGTLYQIFGNFYRRWNVPSVVKKASKILTVSDYERKRILDHFKMPDNIVETVHNGVGDAFKKVTDTSVLQSIKTKYNLPDNYVFFLGNTDPKKNVEGVMKALSILRKANKLTFTLLMLDIDREYLQRIATSIDDVEILNHISFSGYIPNYELPAIYSLAQAFLYPSLRESFGIPILEAMACEIPVITSNTSSMPEVAGDAALYMDPFNPNTIAEALTSLLTNHELKKNLIAKGIDRVKEFSWRNNAAKTLQIYSSLQS
ncbi:MAG TPA: glycosyltransferase family 1 protein [Cyclobacteriaceae bacterium]